MAVRVQVPLAVLNGNPKHISLLRCVRVFHLQVVPGTYAESPARGTERKEMLNMKMLASFC